MQQETVIEYLNGAIRGYIRNKRQIGLNQWSHARVCRLLEERAFCRTDETRTMYTVYDGNTTLFFFRQSDANDTADEFQLDYGDDVEVVCGTVQMTGREYAALPIIDQ